MPKIELGTGGSFLLDGKPYQRGVYEPDFSGDFFGIKRIGTAGNAQDMLVAKQRFDEWTDTTDTPYASINALAADLQNFFFRNVVTGLFAFDGKVDTFGDLPPAAEHADEIWFVRQKTGSRLTFNLRRRGSYISDGVNWLEKEVPNHFQDNLFLIFDEANSSRQVQFSANSVTGTRVLTAQDKSYVIADDVDTFKYEERWDVFAPTSAGAWHVVTLPNAPANRLVFFGINNGNNANFDCGIRAVGSSLNRTVTQDRNTVSNFIAKTDVNGAVEVFVDAITQVTLIVESYLN